MLCVHNGSAFRFSSKTEVYVECLAWRAMTAMGRTESLSSDRLHTTEAV